MIYRLLLPLYVSFLSVAVANGQWTAGRIAMEQDVTELTRFADQKSDNEPKDLKHLKQETSPLLESTNAAGLDRKPQGKRMGQLLGYNAEGTVVFVAGYHRNKIEGAWVGHYRDGSIRDEGNFLRNMPDGAWKGYYSNGQPRYIRHYSASKWFALQAEIKRRHPKLQHFALTADAMQGGALYDHATSANQSFATLPQDASPYAAPFEYCLHDGLYLNYYANGVAKDSGYYKDGLREGVWQERHRNGSVRATGFYIAGQKHGGWTLYNDRGDLISLTEYRRGQMIHQKFYGAEANP